MKIAYYAETDSLYIDLGTGPSVESREVSPGVVIDLDQEGNIWNVLVHAEPRKRGADDRAACARPA